MVTGRILLLCDVHFPHLRSQHHGNADRNAICKKPCFVLPIDTLRTRLLNASEKYHGLSVTCGCCATVFVCVHSINPLKAPADDPFEGRQVNSNELVPGDVYEVSDPYLTQFPCDGLLLAGDCIVNESMLTGELMLL